MKNNNFNVTEYSQIYDEFKDKISDCEFVGCTHMKEENCGIKKAIQESYISFDRYDRFCKIYQELRKKEVKKKW